MLIEEEVKPVGEVNPDALEGVFEEVIEVEEDIVVFTRSGDEESSDDDELDLAFDPNDEKYW